MLLKLKRHSKYVRVQKSVTTTITLTTTAQATTYGAVARFFFFLWETLGNLKKQKPQD